MKLCLLYLLNQHLLLNAARSPGTTLSRLAHLPRSRRQIRFHWLWSKPNRRCRSPGRSLTQTRLCQLLQCLLAGHPIHRICRALLPRPIGPLLSSRPNRRQGRPRLQGPQRLPKANRTPECHCPLCRHNPVQATFRRLKACQLQRNLRIMPLMCARCSARNRASACLPNKHRRLPKRQRRKPPYQPTHCRRRFRMSRVARRLHQQIGPLSRRRFLQRQANIGSRCRNQSSLLRRTQVHAPSNHALRGRQNSPPNLCLRGRRSAGLFPILPARLNRSKRKQPRILASRAYQCLLGGQARRVPKRRRSSTSITLIHRRWIAVCH